MDFKHIRMASQITIGSAPVKQVFVYIVTSANPETHEAYLTKHKIMKETELSESAVKRAIRTLLGLDLLFKHSGNGRGTYTTFKVRLNRILEMLPREENTPLENHIKGASQNPFKGGLIDPLSNKGGLTDPKGGLTDPKGGLTDPHYNNKNNKNISRAGAREKNAAAVNRPDRAGSAMSDTKKRRQASIPWFDTDDLSQWPRFHSDLSAQEMETWRDCLQGAGFGLTKSHILGRLSDGTAEIQGLTAFERDYLDSSGKKQQLEQELSGLLGENITLTMIKGGQSHEFAN